MGIGLALETASGIMKAKGEAEGLAFKASQAMVAARAGKTAAAEIDTHLRDELKTTLGHIDAIRASSGIDPSSPTTQAILSNESRISERQRRIKVSNALSQATEDARSSSFLRGAGRDAFLYGTIGAVGRGFSQAASYGAR
jgi:hypothetical protein